MPKKKFFLPSVPLPFEKALRLSRPFRGVAESVSPFFPYLKLKLIQAEIDVSARDFLSVGLMSACFVAFFGTTVVFVMSSLAGLGWSFWAAITAGIFFGLLQFFYHVIMPNVRIERKTREIERNLIFSMRNLLVQVSSGVPIFTALTTIARGNYGLVSEEFEKAVDRISTGTPQDVALGDMTLGNPSVFFRRSIWQITNGMRAGSNITEILNSVIENLAKEQSIQIKKYGSQLNPLALVYMMVSVVVPALGMTFIIVLSSFPALSVPEFTFWAFLGVLAVVQFMLLGLIKSRRPNLLE